MEALTFSPLEALKKGWALTKKHFLFLWGSWAVSCSRSFLCGISRYKTGGVSILDICYGTFIDHFIFLYRF